MTDITLPQTISSPGSYTVTNDYTGAGVALTVDAANVIVDFASHTINTSQSAIYLTTNADNCEIHHFTITAAAYGILCGGSDVINIHDASISGCSDRGIDGSGCTDVTLTDVDFANCGDQQIYFYTASGITMLRVTSTDSAGSYTCKLSHSDTISITDCEFSEVTTYGVALQHVDDVTITNTDFTNCDIGVNIDDAGSNITFEGCTWTDCPAGINADLGTNVTVSRCTFDGSTSKGIWVNTPNTWIIKLTDFIDCAIGCELHVGTVTVKNCDFTGCTTKGLYISSCATVEVRTCTFTNNAIGVHWYYCSAPITQLYTTYSGNTDDIVIDGASPTITGGAAPTHTITTTADDESTISPTSPDVTEGEDQIFTITTTTTLEDVLADDVSVGIVSTYTFQEVTTTHTLEAQSTAAAVPETSPPSFYSGPTQRSVTRNPHKYSFQTHAQILKYLKDKQVNET